MDASTDAPANAAPLRADTREREIQADVTRHLQGAGETLRILGATFRFVVFCLYAVLGVIAFWLWVASSLLFLIRCLLNAVLAPLLWLSEGSLRNSTGEKRSAAQALVYESRVRWMRPHDLYAAIARPVGRTLHESRRGAHRFWDFTFPRKLLVIAFGFFFVFLPGTYLVPRVHYVQVLDDDAINHLDNGARVEYLIHAVDLFQEGQIREYRNQNMWWLGKINSQGMKNVTVPGRFYKFWVVGLRWYMPQLYPNLIAVTETNAQGVPLEHPSHFIPATTTGK